ncbi:P-loop containing nucleoside triphosphate hydrolase protein [Trichoderma austrokoningii]
MNPHGRQKSPMRDEELASEFLHMEPRGSAPLPRHFGFDNGSLGQGETGKQNLASHYTISRDETSLGSSGKDKLRALRKAGDDEQVAEMRGMRPPKSQAQAEMQHQMQQRERQKFQLHQQQMQRQMQQRERQQFQQQGNNDERQARIFGGALSFQNNMPESQPDSMVLFLQAKVRELQNENERLLLHHRKQENVPNVNFEVFHYVSREAGTETYLEEPYWVKTSKGIQLKANSPVLYPDAYIQYKSLEFIIERYYSAVSETAPEIFKALRQNQIPDPIPSVEHIRLVSKDMMEAIKSLGYSEDPRTTPAILIDKVMVAPYYWCLSQPQEKLVRKLTDWIDDHYGEIYSRIDSQFERGVVSAASISFLIRPGDVLVCTDQDNAEAYIASSSLQRVDAWSYRYNGDFFKVTKKLSIKLSDDAEDAEIPIRNMNVFPLRFASHELRESLEKRGKTQTQDLNVDRIREVCWNKSAFSNLVADPETKELVQALVTNKVAAEKGTDLMQNKGNGLIMLLHGGPGTGKTFTAESVAEMAEKPLYPVTCGDIGIKPEDVEKYLESVFHLGKIWGCVVLLDEAEVFLEQRSLNDLARNALVPVFLRALEYYDGILILTSNRVGTFDEAFKRAQVWRNFFRRLKSLEEDNIDYDDVESYIGELSEREMNGRQIRNVITTARQWAQFQRKTMTATHLKYAIKVTGKFDAYIKDVKEGYSDEQIARGDGVR